MGEINNSFDHIEANEKLRELSVVLYADSFFYGFWNSDDQLVSAGSDKFKKMKGWLLEQSQKYDFKVIRLLSTVKPYVHIPESEYDEKFSRDYFKGLFSVSKAGKKKFVADAFVKEEINTIHLLPKKIIKISEELDCPVKTTHISTALANYAYLIDEDFVSYLSHNSLHIAYTKGGKFQFYNQFDCHYKMDYLYYYLMCMNKLGIQPEKVSTNIGGWITESSPMYGLLYAYLAKINLRDPAIKFKDSVPADFQHYFDLYLCKSCA